MLRQLHISDLGVIGDLDIEPAAGLTVLTGETGAGKTMITVGLSLALGGRGSAQLVRGGARAARVQARFDAPAAAEEWSEDGEVILARSVGADGRSSARIGGQLATASTLADLGTRLVEIHGQHGSLALLDATTQTAFLDRFVGAEQLSRLADYRVVYRRLLDTRRDRESLVAAARDRERSIDLLDYQVREIEAVAPSDGATDALEAEAGRLAHAERLLELGDAAEHALAADGAAGDLVATAAAALEAMTALDGELTALHARTAAVAAEVGDLAAEVRVYRDRVALDPTRLQEVRERLAALRGLQRKYGASDVEVLAFLERARSDLRALQTADERLAEIDAEVAVAEQQVDERARAISEARRAAAPRLADELTGHLRDLGMPQASLLIDVLEDESPGPLGIDRVAVRFQPGTSQPALPLAKAASGGELSRVMLACRSVLADLDDIPTLVFDEVDAGIGGEAGLAVGRRLAQLAAERQVLVVTHLPQIACFASLHLRVRKDDGIAIVDPLGDGDRVVELSRMLAGMERSEHALSHAEELLEEAARARSVAS